MIRYGMALAALVLAAGFSAQAEDAAPTDLKSRIAAACAAEGGKVDDAVVDCACAADVADAELTAEQKAMLEASMASAEEKDPAKQMEILKQAGLDPDKPEEMQKKMEELETAMKTLDAKITEKCTKK